MRTIISDKGQGRVAMHFRTGEAAEETAGLSVAAEFPAAAAELQALAKQADEWRKVQGWSVERFLREFGAAAGDSKTFTQLRDKRPESWDRKPETWLPKYRKLPGLLRAYAAKEEDAPLLEELPQTHLFLKTVDGLRKQTGLRRCYLVEGKTGMGKTSLLDLLTAEVGASSVVRIRGRESWKSFGVMLEDWLRALGGEVAVTKRPKPAARLQEEIRALLLKAGNVVIAVDEWHYSPAQGINALKDWVTDAKEAGSGVHFVLCAIPTLLNNLTGRFPEEARQLIVNRTFDRMELKAPEAAECLQLMRQQVALPEDMEEEAGEMLAAAAVKAGGRALVRDVRAEALRMPVLSVGTLRALIKQVEKKNRRENGHG